MSQFLLLFTKIMLFTCYIHRTEFLGVSPEKKCICRRKNYPYKCGGFLFGFLFFLRAMNFISTSGHLSSKPLMLFCVSC